MGKNGVCNTERRAHMLCIFHVARGSREREREKPAHAIVVIRVGTSGENGAREEEKGKRVYCTGALCAWHYRSIGAWNAGTLLHYITSDCSSLFPFFSVSILKSVVWILSLCGFCCWCDDFSLSQLSFRTKRDHRKIKKQETRPSRGAWRQLSEWVRHLAF